MMKYFILLGTGLCLFSGNLYSQEPSFKVFNYDNPRSSLRFSLNIPRTWAEVQEPHGSSYIRSFFVLDSLGGASKSLCLDSVKYKLRYFSVPIPEAMEKMGFIARGNDLFQFEYNDFINLVVGFEIKGNNYTGLNCSFRSNLPCEKKKSKKKAGEIQFLFFTNGHETVCLQNNGIALPEEELKEIEKTFQFN